MSDPSSHLSEAPPAAWPAARPTGISPIQHPAWEEARNAVLDLAAAGPVTAVIVGGSGTGKSWLLRELASSLGDHGFPTMMLMQGDLPMRLSSGAALLVDEASLMDAPTRAQMSAQQHGVAILAAAEWVDAKRDPASPSPVIIRLRSLQPREIADFAAEWLKQSGLSNSVIGPGMLARLKSESGGKVGTLVQLLAASTAAWQGSPAIAPAETPAEQPIAPPIPPEPVLSAPVPPTLLRYEPERRRRHLSRPLLAGAAIAATIVMGWTLMPATPPARIAQRDDPPPLPLPVIAAAASIAAAPLPPLRDAETSNPAQTVVADMVPPAPAAAPIALSSPFHADTPNPALVTASTPTEPTLSAPLLPAQRPESDAVRAPVETKAPTPSPAIAAASPPSVLTPSEPTLVATLNNPASSEISALPESPPSSRVGGPGLVLVAQRGDTLQSLYGSVYRDRSAPPFSKILAANPGRFKPGAIVVFPEPPGGWQRVHR